MKTSAQCWETVNKPTEVVGIIRKGTNNTEITIMPSDPTKGFKP